MRYPLTRQLPSIMSIVAAQHLEDAILLRNRRSMLVRAPHIKLARLERADERLAAHLDALALAGEKGQEVAHGALETLGIGQLFVAAVLAIQDRDQARIESLLTLSNTLEAERALNSVFGWVPISALRELMAALLISAEPRQHQMGLAACAMHHVDPGPLLLRAIEHPVAQVRLRALRAAGELGRRDLLAACLASLNDTDPQCRSAAARSALLLGDRGSAVQAVCMTVRQAGLQQPSRLASLIFSDNADVARAVIRDLTLMSAPARILLRAGAWAGDLQVIPWSINQMVEQACARSAGEAFNIVTGADLAELGLDRDPPEDFQSGPNDDPNDDNVAMDEDEDLPWPDPVKVADWWHKNKHNFQPGVRYFMGKPVTVEHCIHVLKTGKQRQRFIAARYLKLLQPERPLFNCAAPAWRQQALLAKM